ncbi:hypothetical protein F5878DRAFT_647651, partial [Lentinula raphanica]
MRPGSPIQGPQDFDVAAVLDQLFLDQQNSVEPPVEDDAEVQSVLSALSELTDSEVEEPDSEIEDEETPSRSTFSFVDCIPSSLRSFSSRFRAPLDEALTDPTESEEFTPPDGLSGLKRRRWLKTQRNHRKKRKKEQLSQLHLDSRLRDITKKRARGIQPIFTPNNFSAESLPHTKKGWAGLKSKLEAFCPELTDLLGEEYQMELVDWNGEDTHGVVDTIGRIIVILGGKPKDKKGERRDRTWTATMTNLKTLLQDARDKMTFTSKQKSSMRGQYPSVAMGTSFGGGSQ